MAPPHSFTDAAPAHPGRQPGGRLGRRLLWLFVGCALLPAAAAAYLSLRSVTRQLIEQSGAHLESLAKASGRTISDRLAFLDSDVRRLAPSLGVCARQAPGSRRGDCGVVLLYAAEEVAWVGDNGAIIHLAGEGHATAGVGAAELRALGPGRSALLTRRDGSSGRALFLVYRPDSAGPRAGSLVVAVSPPYLWSPADEEGLPVDVELAVWDADGKALFGSRAGPAAGSLPGARILGREWSRIFEWRDAGSARLGAVWTFPASSRVRPAGWRVVASESREAVTAPMAAFARTAPLLLLGVLGLVLGMGSRQIRRSLAPLAELSEGTRRIAARDFERPVRVASGDELEDLADAFNAMTAELRRQFHALRTAADIDRAVLSSVDARTIAETVLDRLPEVLGEGGASLTLLDPEGASSATTWLRLGPGPAGRSSVRGELGAEETLAARQQPERMVFGGGGDPLPGYLAHFRSTGDEAPVEAYPLRCRGELIGVLAIRARDGAAAGDAPLQMRRLADQVAVALSNARMVDQVRFLAFYDNLTRLPNRMLFKERLGQALARAERSRRLIAVCCVGLDQLGRINDALGHELGDRILRETAARLLVSCRRGDSVARLDDGESATEVARLGGDEFCVMLTDLTGPQDAIRIARRLLESLQAPLRIGDHEVVVTASIGIAIHPFDGADPDELLKHADVAMADAKAQGPNTSQLYSASMHAEVSARLELEQRLRRAVEAGEFTLWYQPIVELDGRKPIGAEALVRWAHPDRGLVSPAEFIGFCEECGLIVPLGEWILRRVCAQARDWETAGLGRLRISVNLSARQLRHPEIVHTVHQVLEETGLRPQQLVLELTESMFMESAGVTGRTIRELAALGVHIAIDDFGTGYSSLGYLKHFPVSSIKIDRSFIEQVTTDADDAAITTAIIALARALELEVVAEGVETEAQAAFLAERGCRTMQGYLVGKPLPAEAFAEYLRERKPRGSRVKGRRSRGTA